MTTTSRLTIDISKEEHKYIKMACAKLGTSIKDFATNAMMDKLYEWEDIWLAEAYIKEKNSTEEEQYSSVDALEKDLLAQECEDSYQSYKKGEVEVICLEDLKKELVNELQSRL